MMLSIRDAARHLGCSTDTVRQLVNRSKARLAGHATSGPTIKFFQTGRYGSIRFRPEWLEEFIDAGTRDPDVSVERPRAKKPRPPVVIPSVAGFDDSFYQV
jgi:hypothetical protein